MDHSRGKHCSVDDAPLRVAFAAGGTGGHIVPALAVADTLKSLSSEDDDLYFIGVGKPLETKLITGAGYPLEIVPFVPVLGKGIVGMLRMAMMFPVSLLQAVSLFKRRKPDVVVAFGGYPSVLPMLAARILKIPRIVHNLDVKVGLANHYMSALATQLTSVQRAKGFWKDREAQQIGNPVRRIFFDIPNWTAPSRGAPYRVLVLGGSQGALSLNSAVIAVIPKLKHLNIELVHQTGANDFERVTKIYEKIKYAPAKVAPFLEDVPGELRAAHLVVSRAGASIVAEIAAARRPAILVPLPIASGHQKENALPVVELGASHLLEQDDNLTQNLEEELVKLLASPERLTEMASAYGPSKDLETIPNAILARSIFELARKQPVDS